MNSFKKYWRIVLPITVALIIWLFSAASGDLSHQQSQGIASFLGWPHGLTRKIAHFVLYLAFGASLAYYSQGRHRLTYPRYESLLFNLVAVAIYGAIDEVHQLLVAGRNGAVSDVVLDTVAGLCGILIYIAFYCLVWPKLRLWLHARYHHKKNH